MMNSMNLAANMNLNMNSQNLLSGFNPAAMPQQSQSFVNRGGVFPQRGMPMQRDLTLGGQISHPLSTMSMQMPMQMPMQMQMQMQGTSQSGSIPLFPGNNNALVDVHLLQRQLAEQRIMQQLAQQQMLRNRYPALLQNLAGSGGMALHGQMNPSLGLLGHGAENMALHRALLPSHVQLQADALSTPSSATLPGTFQGLAQESEPQEPDLDLADLAKTRSFPAKLFRMLEDPDCQEYISWQPHGRSWKIHNQHEFEEKVIPLFFRHAKLSSFMRQVNGWGFLRTPTGPDQNAYHHEMFRRGFPQLCAKMRRPPHKFRSTSDREANRKTDQDDSSPPSKSAAAAAAARDSRKVSASAAKSQKLKSPNRIEDAEDSDVSATHDDSDEDS